MRRNCLQRLVSAGASVNSFEIVQPSLHQIFLEKVGATGIEDGDDRPWLSSSRSSSASTSSAFARMVHLRDDLRPDVLRR